MWTNILYASFGVSLLSPCDRFVQIKKKNLDPLKTNERNAAWRQSTGLTVGVRVVSWDAQNVFGMHIPLQMLITKRRFRENSATG